MKLKFPKTVTIGSYKFAIKKNKKNAGASFNFKTREIIIGTEHIEEDENSVFGLICHELMEISSVITSTRYNDPCVTENYKFVMDHKEFETTIEVFSKALSEFIA